MSRTAAWPGMVVTDDWPDFVPITEVELRVMEGHGAHRDS